MFEVTVILIIVSLVSFVSEFLLKRDAIEHPKVSVFEDIGFVFGILTVFLALAIFPEYTNQLSPTVFFIASSCLIIVFAALGYRFATFHNAKMKPGE